MDKSVTKYPKQVYGECTGDTFSIESYLEIAKGVREDRKADSPLHVCDETFSRYKGIVINEGKSAFFNIPVKDVPGIFKRSEYASKLQLDAECKSMFAKEDLSPAYTVRLQGKFNGKTPAAVLLENPEGGPQSLNEQYKWLKNNCTNPKFAEANRLQMEAIADAGRLLKEGKLSKESVGISSVKIYEQTMRPLMNKQREDGKYFVYGSNISYNIGKKYPLTIECKNYYAPVSRDEKGLLNVQAKQADTNSIISNKIDLSFDSWEAICYWWKNSFDGFYFSHYSECEREANQIFFDARTNH